MTKITVDADELKTMGSRLINLARNKVHDPKITQNHKTFHSVYQFSNQERLVFEFVMDNPGTIQENVVKNVKEYSRMTILKAIHNLEKEGFIEIREDEHRNKKYHLFINKTNELVSLIEDLDHFKESFFNLVNQAKGILKSLKIKTNTSNRLQEFSLIDALLMPYKFLVSTWIISDLILRHKKPIDTNILIKKFAIISTKIPELQVELYESITKLSTLYVENEIYGKIFESGLQALTCENIYDMLHKFEEHGLSKSAEEVLDIVWKMSLPLLRIVIDSDYLALNPGEPERLTDWRKLICPPIFQYKPRTTQNSYRKSYE